MDCSLPGSSVHGIFPGKNTGVDCHSFLQGIFPIQELNLAVLHSRQILYCLSHQRSWDISTEEAQKKAAEPCCRTQRGASQKHKGCPLAPPAPAPDTERMSPVPPRPWGLYASCGVNSLQLSKRVWGHKQLGWSSQETPPLSPESGENYSLSILVITNILSILVYLVIL